MKNKVVVAGFLTSLLQGFWWRDGTGLCHYEK